MLGCSASFYFCSSFVHSRVRWSLWSAVLLVLVQGKIRNGEVTDLLPVTLSTAQSLTVSGSLLLLFLQFPKAGVKSLLVIDVCDPGSVCVLCAGGNFSEPGDPSRGYLYSLKGREKVGMWEWTGEGGISSNSKNLLLFSFSSQGLSWMRMCLCIMVSLFSFLFFPSLWEWVKNLREDKMICLCTGYFVSMYEYDCDVSCPVLACCRVEIQP